MWRIVFSMTVCLLWTLLATSQALGYAWVIIGFVGGVLPAIGVIHLVMSEWEEELVHP